MMNLRKIEKIAAKLEEELGMNDAGDELIDKAEEEVAKEENVQESIDENIEKEKKEEEGAHRKEIYRGGFDATLGCWFNG